MTKEEQLQQEENTKRSTVIIKKDGTCENGLGQEFIPDTITFPATYRPIFIDGKETSEIVDNPYTKPVIDLELSPKEIEYIKSQGKSYGEEYLKCQGFNEIVIEQ